MEMHEVRYFLAVARTLNFTRAADECHVAQPSLSRAIKKLEDELGGDLFRRERTLNHLTDLGRMMLPVLAQCYESAISAKALAKSYKKGTVLPLRLALSHTIHLGLLAGPLTNLVKTFSGLELKFFRGTADEVAEDLKAGGSELAVAGRFGNGWERFENWPLFSEQFSLVVNKKHPLAMRNMIEFKQLPGERLLGRNYCEVSAQLSEILAAQGVDKSTGDRIAADHDVLSLLEANLGVAILPESTPMGEKLCRIGIEGLAHERTVYVHAVAGRERSPAASALLKLLRVMDWPRITMSSASGSVFHDPAPLP